MSIVRRRTVVILVCSFVVLILYWARRRHSVTSDHQVCLALWLSVVCLFVCMITLQLVTMISSWQQIQFRCGQMQVFSQYWAKKKLELKLAGSSRLRLICIDHFPVSVVIFKLNYTGGH